MTYCVIVALAVVILCSFVACNNDSENDAPKNISFEMVLISGGNFIMGSDDDGAAACIAPRPERTVMVDSFYIGKYQITQVHYLELMGTNPSFFQSTNIPSGVNGNNLPVETVNWYNAVEFCNKISERDGFNPAYNIDKINKDPNNAEELDTIKWMVSLIDGSDGYRLPTEAQWEYACRAATTTAYNTGDTISNETGWYNANSSGRTQEVGKKAPNAWGLYDMHGNVWEWCWDYVNFGGDNYYDIAPDPDTNPLGLNSGNRRAERGGSWKSPPNRVTSSYRERYRPHNTSYDLGFRVVRPNEQ